MQQRAAFKAALCFKYCSNLRVKIQDSHMKDYNQGQWWKQEKIDGECPNLKESVLNVATFKFRVLFVRSSIAGCEIAIFKPAGMD